MKIGISGQYGEPKASSIFWSLQKSYNDIFKNSIVNKYFKNIQILSIIFRVSGNIQDFKSEGPERLKYIKKDSVITIDLVIPMEAWKGKPISSVKKLVIEGVDECLHLLISKAEQLGEIINLNQLQLDIKKAKNEFKEN